MRLVAARLPCLTTGTWQAAATIAAAVEMLRVPAPSPPVPHVSSRVSRRESALPRRHPIADGLDCPYQLIGRFTLLAQRREEASGQIVGCSSLEQSADRLRAFPPLKAQFPP